MTANLLDGKLVSSRRRNDLKIKVQDYVSIYKQHPGLAVILVGNDPASAIYVHNKRQACDEAGIQSYAYDLNENVTETQLLELIDKLNSDNSIHGILVQLPLPKHISEKRVTERINPLKDVDGFHPYNIGRLAQRNPLLRPCTPLGIINLLEFYSINLQGKHAVVVGASNIVGRPLCLELLLAGATVTTCHRFTQNLEQFIRMADIVIVATGIRDLVEVNWLHKEQIVIDVGIHRLENQVIRGDIDFDKTLHTVAWLTPVPGGVGPMTVTTLLENTYLAATLQIKREEN